MSEVLPTARALLAQASWLQRAGRHPQALPLLREAVRLQPESAYLHRALGEALADCGDAAAAVQCFGEALQRKPQAPHELHLHRAVLFADRLRRDEAAEAELQHALALKPDYLPALMNLGNLYEQRGLRTEALACYRRVLSEPAFASEVNAGLRAVARARSLIIQPPASSDDAELHALLAALGDPVVGADARVHVEFALGHSYDRLCEVAHAFSAFSRGNAGLIALHGVRYQPARQSGLGDELIRCFDRGAAPGASATPRSVTGPTPLFICGMFRSGSTLVEQVLAAHPAVVPGGEVDWLLRLVVDRLSPFPQSMARLDAADLRALADEYMTHLRDLFPTADDQTFITDKRPENFQFIGLIKRLLPDAKFIHTVRHPVDNGLSVFMQHINPRVAPYACRLEDIGHYYGEYRRLMAHWKSLYPQDILDFDYDVFIRSPEDEARRVLAFVGLPWDASCLEFHKLRNTVKTASYWQVRQPIFDSASGRWRRYLPHLEPLLQALRERGVQAA